MSSNDGKAAQDAFVARILAQPNTVVERFYDQSDLRGLNRGRAVGDFPKPSDFLVTQNGRLRYAEVKSIQGAVSFPFGNIETGQRSAALRQAAAGAGDCYHFYIFSYGTSEWYVMTADQFAEAIKAEKKSIKLQELKKWQ